MASESASANAKGSISDPQRLLEAAELAKHLGLLALDLGRRTDEPAGEPDEVALRIMFRRLDFGAEIGGAIREPARSAGRRRWRCRAGCGSLWETESADKSTLLSELA